MRTCEICGRRLRTGIKYCYEHRSMQKAGGIKKEEGLLSLRATWILAIVGIIIFIISLFSKDKIMYVIGMVVGLICIPLLIGLIFREMMVRTKRCAYCNKVTKGKNVIKKSDGSNIVLCSNCYTKEMQGKNT